MASWDELYDDAARRLASAVLPLLSQPDRWIQRRVENITITSQRLVRRTVSVDLVLPDVVERLILGLDPNDADSPLVVALGMLRKAQLIDFDRSAGSTRHALLRSGLNTRVAAAVLANLAALEGRPHEAIQAAGAYFELIVGPDQAQADDAYDSLFGDGARAPRETAELQQGEALKTVARQLCDSYMLIELPDTGVRHRLVSFATDQVLDWRPRSVWQRLALASIAIELSAPGASQAASYHAELSVPAGCVLSSVQHGLSRSVLTAVTAAALGAAAAVALGATPCTLAGLWSAFLAVCVLGTSILIAGVVNSVDVGKLTQETS